MSKILVHSLPGFFPLSGLYFFGNFSLGGTRFLLFGVRHDMRPCAGDKLGGRGKDPLTACGELVKGEKIVGREEERRRKVVRERETRTSGQKSSTLFIRERFGREEL